MHHHIHTCMPCARHLVGASHPMRLQYWKVAIAKTEAASREVATAQLSARKATSALKEAQQLETAVKSEGGTVEKLLSEAEGQRAKIPVSPAAGRGLSLPVTLLFVWVTAMPA